MAILSDGIETYNAAKLILTQASEEPAGKSLEKLTGKVLLVALGVLAANPPNPVLHPNRNERFKNLREEIRELVKTASSKVAIEDIDETAGTKIALEDVSKKDSTEGKIEALEGILGKAALSMLLPLSNNNNEEVKKIVRKWKETKTIVKELSQQKKEEEPTPTPTPIDDTPDSPPIASPLSTSEAKEKPAEDKLPVPPKPPALTLNTGDQIDEVLSTITTEEEENNLPPKSLCDKIKDNPKTSLSIIFAVGFVLSTGIALICWQRKKIFNWIKTKG